MMTKCKFALLFALVLSVSTFVGLVAPTNANATTYVDPASFMDGSQTQFLQAMSEIEQWVDNGAVFANDPALVGVQTELTGWTNAVTSASFTTAEVDAGLEAAAVSVGIAPGVLAATIVGAGAAAAYVGYRWVGPWIGNTVYSLLHSDDSLSATNGYYWSGLTSSGSVSASGLPTIGTTTGTYATPIWYLSTCFVGGSCGAVKNVYCDPTSGVFSTCETGSGVASSAISTEVYNWATGSGAGAASTQKVYNTAAASGCGSVAAGNCFYLVRADQAQNAQTKRTRTDSTGCAGAPTGCKVTPALPTPSITQQQFNQMLQYLKSLAASAAENAAAANAALAAIGALVNPNWGGPGTTASSPVSTPWTVKMLPLPAEGEDAATYVDRVRQIGWIGPVTTVDDTDYESGLLTAGGCVVTCDYLTQPVGTIAGVSLTGSTPTVFYAYVPTDGTYAPPVSMPLLLTADTGVTLYTKPSTTSFPATGGSSGTPAAIDWSPITSTDMGSKFPFGAFNYIPAIDGPSTCPDLNIPWPSALGSGSSDISFCSTTWETDFRPWVFPIVEILMTVAGIAFLAFKVFGTSSGD